MKPHRLRDYRSLVIIITLVFVPVISFWGSAKLLSILAIMLTFLSASFLLSLKEEAYQSTDVKLISYWRKIVHSDAKTGMLFLLCSSVVQSVAVFKS